MKKVIKTIGILSIGAMFLASCDRTDDLVTINTVTNPTLVDINSTSYVVTEDNLSKVIELGVKKAVYGVSSEVRTELEIALAGTNFEKVAVVGAYTLDDTLKVTYKQLNDALLVLGVKPGVATNIEVRVKSYLYSNTVTSGGVPTYSDVQTITATAYSQGPNYQYQDWFLIGSATAADWSNDKNNINLLPLLKDVNNPNKYTFTGYFKQGEFKLVKTKGDWGVNYGGRGGSLVSGGDNIAIPADGYYTLSFDLEALTYTVTSVATPVNTYNTVGIIGSATANGWDASTPMVQSTFDPNLWILSGIRLSAGELKFRADNDWAVNWGGTAEFFGKATQDGGNIKVEAAYTYTIYFNSATGEYSILPTE